MIKHMSTDELQANHARLITRLTELTRHHEQAIKEGNIVKADIALSEFEEENTILNQVIDELYERREEAYKAHLKIIDESQQRVRDFALEQRERLLRHIKPDEPNP